MPQKYQKNADSTIIMYSHLYSQMLIAIILTIFRLKKS